MYAVDLPAGQQVTFRLVSPDGLDAIRFYNSGSVSLDADNSLAWSQGVGGGGVVETYTAAIAGTYYVALIADGSSQPYTLSVT